MFGIVASGVGERIFQGGGEGAGGFDRHFAQQVARIARAHALDAFAAQPEDLPRLRLGRDLDLGRALERGDLDLPAERRLREADRHLAVQIVPVALEDPVGLEVDHSVEIARRTAIHAGLALAGQADAIALIDARGNLHRQGLVLLDAPGAAAGRAGVGHHLAGAVAGGTRLLDREEALRQPHRPRAVAGVAGLGLRAGLRAGALAGLARFHRGDADLGRGAPRGLLEGDLQVVAQVGAAEDGGTAAALAAAENVAEDVAEGFREAAEPFLPGTRAHLRIYPRVAIGVVGAALLGVTEALVGFLRLLQLLLPALPVRIPIRMVLHRELPVRLLDLLLGGVLVQSDHFIVVALPRRHRVSGSPCLTKSGPSPPNQPPRFAPYPP